MFLEPSAGEDMQVIEQRLFINGWIRMFLLSMKKDLE